MLAALALGGLVLWSPVTLLPPTEVTTAHAAEADFGGETASGDAHRVADWVVATNDAGGLPFVIVDKSAARMFIFGENGRLRAAASVLLGAAPGDHTVPDIGERPIEEVLPEERTTPAGRFVGEPGHNARGEDVVWVDYDAAVSIHRVLTTNLAERRLERLATPTVDDNRISYGCINVPLEFYEMHIRPVFAAHRAVIYVLPEERSPSDVFPSLRAA